VRIGQCEQPAPALVAAAGRRLRLHHGTPGVRVGEAPGGRGPGEQHGHPPYQQGWNFFPFSASAKRAPMKPRDSSAAQNFFVATWYSAFSTGLPAAI